MNGKFGWFKLICTVGPASRSPAVLREMEALGASVFRINLSHTPLADLDSLIKEIRAATEVPICLDTEGAQIRTGRMEGDQVHLKAGEKVLLTSEETLGTAEKLPLYPAEAADLISPGMMLHVDFDACVLAVREKTEKGCLAQVVNSGRVGSNKGVAMEQEIPLPALTQKDREAIAIARRLGIRLYSYSFCSSAAAVRLLQGEAGPEAAIISKIESRASLVHLEEIIEESSALLVDRGDLSRSVDMEEIPAIQKFVVRKAHQKPMPVFVATNLLESMVERPYPTRAEVNDIANTLLDGANGLVLAAETAIGKYPVQCVEMVMRLMRRYHQQGDRLSATERGGSAKNSGGDRINLVDEVAG